jgi:hypothetical protein
MSQPHQIAIVPVSTALNEVIHLADVMGRVPVEEMVEVLNSQWAAARGWRRVAARQDTYQRTVNQDVTLEVRVGGEGDVTIQRLSQTRQVASDQAARVGAEQQQQLQSAAEECDRAVNELIGQALMRALPVRARELGYHVVTEQVVQQQGAVYEMVLQVEVNV